MSDLTINPKEFGIEEKKATELTSGLNVPLKERELLIEEFNEVSKLEITKDNIPVFSDLRKRIMKNRTQGINKWHKTAKEWFLAGGKFVDATKRKEIDVNEKMEEKLMQAEKHFENLEIERLNKLQLERVDLLSKYVDDASERDLKSMDMDVWDAYLATKKKEYEDILEAEKKAEQERLAKEKAEKEEQERIRLENEKLKKEAEERERLAKIEQDKRDKEEADRKAKEDKERKEREAKERKEREEYEDKLRKEREERESLEAQIKAKKEAEEKAKKELEEAKENELKKGDEDKFKDLLSDLENIKTKYDFKSKANKTKYKDVCNLIDKVITHIK